jgi:endonuclease/exonuclease/phosphatase family metal-dependent hydrolase
LGTVIRRGGRWLAVLGLLAAGACSSDDSGSGDVPDAATVSVVSQNLLHGTACAEDSDRCDLPARVGLFVDQLAEADCPNLVSLQEANQQTVDELTPLLADVCDGAYEIVWDDDPSLDREVVLTTEPVVGQERIHLAGPLRTALWVRVAGDVGIVDYVSTHLASGSDNRPCDETTCPPPCEPDEMINSCQAKQVVAYAQDRATADSVVVLGGDLNATVGQPAIDAIIEAGFVDTHLAGGNDECDPDTGDQCTGGRIDDAMTDLEDPESQQRERIDFLFVGGDRDCEVVDPTGLFNGEPAAGDLAFPSDHTGVVATLSCPTTTQQVEDAPTATVATTAPPTTEAGAEIDADTEAAVAQAFTNVFDGTVTDTEVKLASLEDGEALRESFLESYEATREVAAGISVRIDALAPVDAEHVDVTYTLLLDGAAVLDHLPGAAVKVGDTWLVSLRTYCDVSTQGVDEIPEPCQ